MPESRVKAHLRRSVTDVGSARLAVAELAMSVAKLCDDVQAAVDASPIHIEEGAPDKLGIEALRRATGSGRQMERHRVYALALRRLRAARVGVRVAIVDAETHGIDRGDKAALPPSSPGVSELDARKALQKSFMALKATA